MTAEGEIRTILLFTVIQSRIQHNNRKAEDIALIITRSQSQLPVSVLTKDDLREIELVKS